MPIIDECSMPDVLTHSRLTPSSAPPFIASGVEEEMPTNFQQVV